jgi:eukaryotic-like serine/threonine-protein kinase
VFRRLIMRVVRRDPRIAVAYYDRGLKFAVRRYGPDSKEALAVRQDYALALHRCGETEKVLAELSAVINRGRVEGGNADDVFLREAELRHEHLQFTVGRFDEMERESRVLSEKYDRVLGPDHPHAVTAHEDHVVALLSLGRFREGEAEIAGVVARRTAAGGSDDADTLRARRHRAACLSALGRHGEAETAWRELAEAKGRLLGETHAGTREAREKHANALYKLGRRQEAAAEYGELAVLSASALGADHADTRRVRGWQADILQGIGNPGNSGPALCPTGR